MMYVDSNGENWPLILQVINGMLKTRDRKKIDLFSKNKYINVCN